MVGPGVQVPEVMPQLARGKHRNPRKGACFMEMASYLAGEKWSDHPACTHPLLAALARLVNDNMSDDRRNELAPMIPSVVGLTSDDPRADIRIMLRAATVALPVVSAERQRVLAVAVLAGERALVVLGDEPGEPGAPPQMGERSREALARVPHATKWAATFTEEMGMNPRGVQKYGAPGAVRHAVVGIAEACIRDPDSMLRDLLAATIADCQAWVEAEPEPEPVAREHARPAPAR